MLVVGLLPVIAGIVFFIISPLWLGIALTSLGVGIIFFAGFRTVRPVERGVIERFGKYTRTKDAGLTWIIPMVEKMYRVNITEQMIDIPPQMVITQDKLNASVDAVVYYRIKDVKASIYNVDDHRSQLTSLARTTLRAVIGNMTLTDANEKRAEIKKAEGVKQGLILSAEGKGEGIKIVANAEADRIKIVNEAADKYFIGNAQALKKLEKVEIALKENVKFILDSDKITTIVTDAAGVSPIPMEKKPKEK